MSRSASHSTKRVSSYDSDNSALKIVDDNALYVELEEVREQEYHFSRVKNVSESMSKYKK